jgi:AraC family transcriptional regulator
MRTSLKGAELAQKSGMHNLVEGDASGVGFHCSVYNTRWSAAGEGVFHSPSSFVEMFLSHESVVGASYRPVTSDAEYRAFGDVMFLTGQEPLYCRWRKGRQRSVSCTFDMAIIGDRWELDWHWPDFERSRSLSAGSDQVRIAMRRIADELLTPGFASVARIEAALVSVATDLRRGIERRPDVLAPAEEQGRDIMTPKQQALIRSMLLDISGPGPSVPELARACGMPARRLAASYRRSTGVTLRSFMSAMRLERAQTLLQSSDSLVKQIAYDSGFGSSSAFVAAFRKATGMTPAAFRAQTGRGYSVDH